MADLVGQTIGQYQIIERLGRGGMADVYKAFHSGLAVYRALKVIRPEFVSEAGFMERFQREARAVAALRHPNIVQMHDFGVQDNLYYMVMEFIEGRDLKTYLAERGQLRPFSEIAAIIEQVASALNYAHQRGVVHRDIKPANIMLNAEGQAILTDFGIAKIISLEEQMTQAGMGIGTPAYMAPEQARGQTNVGPPADIYSLGVVLYEMLTGRVPFSADTPLAVMMKVVNDPILPPRDFSPDIPDVLQGVVLKATAKDPAQRYPTAEALVDALKRSLDARPGVAPPDSMTRVTPSPKAAPARRRMPWLIAGVVLVVLLCLLVGLGAVWLFWPRPEPSLARWYFVIDASEGMNESIGGQTRMEIAQAALAEELDILPPNIDAGLRVFGGGVSGQPGCDDTRLLVEPAAKQNEQLATALAGVTPGGEAPLTKAIVQTIGDFDPNSGTKNPLIIIITAGLDTCEENAVEQLEKLSSRMEFDYELRLIGLGIADETEQTQLRQIAEAAGGQYREAENPTDIGRVIEEQIAALNPAETPTQEGESAGEEEAAGNVTPTAITSSSAGETGLQFGEMVSGDISSIAETDTYTFEAAEGDQVVIRMAAAAAEFSPEAQLIAPDGQPLCSNWQYADQILNLTCQLTAAGRYTLLARSHENSGSYNLYVQRTNDPAKAAPIGFNEMVSGTAANTVERMTYTFEAAGGDYVVVRMAAATAEFAPEAQLYGPDGWQLCSTWQYADQTLNLECQLAAAGRHTLLVGSHENSGQYNLFLQRTNDPAGATTIAFDETASGTVTNIVEGMTYTFEAAGGDQVVIRIAAVEAGFAPELHLYAPNGQPLCSNWQYADQTLNLDCQLTNAGQHTLLVGSHQNSGQYDLYLQRTNDPANATTIEFSETVSGAVPNRVEGMTYTFEAAGGDQVVIRMAALETEFAPEVRLYAPNGQLLCSNWQYADQTLNLDCQLERAGRHTLLVGSYQNSGQYSLYLQRTNDPAKATTISFDETVSGVVTGTVERVAYTFEAAGGDQVVVRMADAEAKVAPEAQLYGPDGVQLCSTWQYADQTLNLDCQLQRAGRHTLLIGSHQNSGQYDLYLQRTNDPANATVIGFDETVSGAVANRVERVAYTFEAVAGDRVVVRMADIEAKVAPEAQLYRPDGTQLCSTWQYADQTLNLECQLTSPGRHTLLVGSHENSGQYNLTLERLN